MSDPVQIRNAEVSDFPDFCNLVNEVDEIHTVQEPEYFRNPAQAGRKREYFESYLGQPDKALFIAKYEGLVAGFIQLTIQKVPELDILVPCDYAHVNDLVVAKTMHRRGIGQALMKHAEAWARQKGLKELRLNVRDWNIAAKKLYESAGLKTKMHNMIKRLN